MRSVPMFLLLWLVACSPPSQERVSTKQLASSDASVASTLDYLSTSPELALHRAMPGRSPVRVAPLEGRAAVLLNADAEPWVVAAGPDGGEVLKRWDGMRWMSATPVGREVRGAERGEDVMVVAASLASFSDLYALPLSGGAPRRLTESSHGCFQPSLRGDVVVYACSADDGSELYRLRLGDDGRVVDRERVTWSAGDDHDPALSPDGTALAWVGWRSDGARIVVADSRGRGARLLRDADVDVVGATPRWAPDGRLLAFVESRGTRTEIVVVNTEDGRTVHRFGEGAADPQWSPDGRQLAFSEAVGERTRVRVVDFGTGVASTVAEAAHSPRWRRAE